MNDLNQNGFLSSGSFRISIKGKFKLGKVITILWEVGAMLARGLFLFCVCSTLFLSDAFYFGCWSVDGDYGGLKDPMPTLGTTTGV